MDSSKYILALHIIFVVTWFAGLFYIVRLFIYHVEAQDKPETERNILIEQYKIMEKRLWYIIAWPSMLLTVVFGYWLLMLQSDLLYASFMRMKLAFVLGLVLYHLQCHKIFNALQNNRPTWKSTTLRLWNELATIFLVAIVFIVILKDTFSFLWGLGGFVLLGVVLFLAVMCYKLLRNKDDDSSGLNRNSQ